MVQAIKSTQNRSTILPCSLDPLPLPQYGAFSMKALARYQIILLGEQRHIRCEQLAQGCCPNNAAAGVEPVTSWSRVWRPTITPPSHHGLLSWKRESAFSYFSETKIAFGFNLKAVLVHRILPKGWSYFTCNFVIHSNMKCNCYFCL